MKNIFLVFGYGIPKNILKDENYNFYLKMVFNHIYNLVIQKGISSPIVICSGGKTDMFKPYQRTEAEEMIKLLKKLVKRPFLKTATQDWLFLEEKESLSTLENFINCKTLLKKKKITKANVYIFCEKTREKRVRVVGKEVFGKSFNFQVMPVDFDNSANRYIAPELIAKKERIELKHSMWALENTQNLKKHHKLFKEKIDYLRKAGPGAHTESVKKWWEEKLKEIDAVTRNKYSNHSE
jgi:hypothetical protein